jgi:Ca2+-transporting ATPase
MSNWWQLSIDDMSRELSSDLTSGLSAEAAAKRLVEYGENKLTEKPGRSPLSLFLDQFKSFIIWVLMGAAAVSGVMAWMGGEEGSQEWIDTFAIISIVALNAILGFVQEYRAEKSLAALKLLAVPKVKVRRNGQAVEILSRNLVPGDVVLFETGNLVPADCRVLECANLRIQEAALTGESEPVEKTSDAIATENLSLGDRRNMAYMGTVITYGRGQAVVTATGMSTELGHIATMIQSMDRESTPLQKRMDQLGKRLAIVALVLVTAIFCIGLWREGMDQLRLVFLTAVSMAVAAIPEGLPAVVTIALALGAQRMLKRRALIRKLPAVETLGSVTVICSDKTGTLTENCMTVTVLDVAGYTMDLTEQLRVDQPVFDLKSDPRISVENQAALMMLLTAGALCNDAELKAETSGTNSFTAIGDPTEGALVVAAARAGLSKPVLESLLPRVAEIPFDSERKRMTTMHALSLSAHHLADPLVPLAVWRKAAGNVSHVAFTKGAVDQILDVTVEAWADGEAKPLTPELREEILSANNRLAKDGMRVLGVAYRPLAGLPKDGDTAAEAELVFVGVVGMVDPPRSEVRDAVRTCQEAGIRAVMITGDHPLTAGYIARDLGITSAKPPMTGQDLSNLTTSQLESVVNDVSVYARVSPQHKMDIVQALQSHGHVVAMTGDGVNDAPALKKADIGVAMGITGTDVSKEAADMVLLDDNFSTIVAAVEEGRTIYANLRKFIKYLLTTNSGEISVMLAAPFFGMPLPLLPLQILWMNLVTDGLPALALAVEPAEKDSMRRPPHPSDEGIFARGLGIHVIWVGMLMAIVSLGMGYWAWSTGHKAWQTMVFTTLALTQMGHVMAIRSERNSLFQIGLFSNRPLLASVLLTIVLQLTLIYVPFMQQTFSTMPLSGSELAISLGLSMVVFIAVEIEKFVIRRSGK